MLPFSPQPSVMQPAKCFFSHGIMGHIDPAQPPAIESVPSSSLSSTQPSSTPGAPNTAKRLKKPWSSIQALNFVSQVDLVLPRNFADEVQAKLAQRPPTASSQPQRYARVAMTLGQVLQGAFFTEYVKAGSILMLSEGRLGQDNVFSLKDGRLTLYLERETYERAGLVGKTHGAKGGRGLRPRWIVELDLNEKAMWPGKSGFDRLLYACQNVFNAPVTWLFCSMFDAPTPDPLDAFSPTWVTVQPAIAPHTKISLPPLGRPASLLVGGGAGSDRLETEEAVVELYEWLSLVRLSSPRVEAADSIDPYLSRYSVPSSDDSDTSSPSVGDLCTLRWRGFLSPTWACQTLLDALVALPSSSSANAWLAMSVSGFATSKGLTGESAECTFFRPSDAPREYLLWEVHSQE
ncbi:hypothetical protein SBRCBS47491_007765 [Sporothrix bragantina]|uniref:Uncharacterized protein n=1 Tax=Sporothrix bragantina TaxID=671064 RepID=A0ABP0CH55_9PEZI